MTDVDDVNIGTGVDAGTGVDGTLMLRRLFRAFFFCSAAAKTFEPVTIESGARISPFGDDGREGMAEVVMERQRLGVLMPVVPSLLKSSRMCEGGSMRRVSSLKIS